MSDEDSDGRQALTMLKMHIEECRERSRKTEKRIDSLDADINILSQQWTRIQSLIIRTQWAVLCAICIFVIFLVKNASAINQLITLLSK